MRMRRAGPNRTFSEALRQYSLSPAYRRLKRPETIRSALAWLERHSLSVHALSKVRNVRLGLDALTLRLDDGAAATTTITRKRPIFYNAPQYVRVFSLFGGHVAGLSPQESRTASACERSALF